MTPLQRYEALVAYLGAKADERDWHAVADAANDLRVIEARYPELVLPQVRALNGAGLFERETRGPA